jgi:DNA invertase Pin-like site-specific DNA recombinase/uncharacterized protein (UPF0218 family)
MIRDSEKGHFQVVITYTIDRFARNRYDSAMYKARLKRNGVRIFYAKQYIPDEPEGIILESVLEGYAEYYSENLSRNIKRGMMENALACKVTGGTTPLGYAIGPDKKYVVDPSGAKIVREVYNMYADGHSAKEIIDYCNEQGYRTARKAKFNKNSLRTILTNDRYIGIYRYGEVVRENGVPAIISKELFEKVQAMYKHNSAARAKSKAKEDYLLTTKLFCGHCGSVMVGESGTARNGSTYRYYKCANRKRNLAVCDKKTERKEWIEEVVVRYTVQTVLTDENIEYIAEKAIEILEKEAAEDSILPHLRESLRDTTKRIKNLLDLMEQGISTESTKERLLELESEKKDLNVRITREENKKPRLTKERIMFWLESFRKGDIDNEDYCKRVIDTLVNSVFVWDTPDGKGRKLVFTFNISGQNTVTLNVSDIACFAPSAGRKRGHGTCRGLFSFWTEHKVHTARCRNVLTG